MHKRHTARETYFKELAQTSEKYFIPFIKKQKPITDRLSIFEIGCGEGGNLLPFAKRGCKVTGIDISETRIKQANDFFASEKAQGIFLLKDIFSYNSLAAERERERERERYDIIITHDVIEHVRQKKELLAIAASLLHAQGSIHVGFPPWQMPFGGHQQIAKDKYVSRIPFIHLLPTFLYQKILKKVENKAVIEELLDIKKCGTSIELFKKTVSATCLNISDEVFYFINPHYETKFGLKPRKLWTVISLIPWVRNFFTTSYFCILAK